MATSLNTSRQHARSDDGQTGGRGADREFHLSDAEFAFLAQTAHKITGIVLGANKRDLVYGRLVRRLRALGLSSFTEYCNLLSTPEGESELGFMVNAITTNLTAFFREPHHFEHLRDVVLRPRAAKQTRGRLRIWSAGSSSGEEPYSIAMTVRSVGELNGWDSRILATDIDTDMVAFGAAGLYDEKRAQSIPDSLRTRFAERPRDGKVQMADSVRSLIAFKQLNLLGPWPMRGPFDVIFCRNVVIYFDKPTQKALFDRYADILADGGWLYIGHSESLHRVTERFRLEGRTIYRKIA